MIDTEAIISKEADMEAADIEAVNRLSALVNDAGGRMRMGSWREIAVAIGVADATAARRAFQLGRGDWTGAEREYHSLFIGAECDDWVQIQGGADENVTPSTQPGAVR